MLRLVNIYCERHHVQFCGGTMRLQDHFRHKWLERAQLATVSETELSLRHFEELIKNMETGMRR